MMQQIDEARRELEVIPPSMPRLEPDLTEDAAAKSAEELRRPRIRLKRRLA